MKAGSRATVIVVAGPAGAGKSAVAGELARRLGWPMADGDDFHPTASIEKMRSGQPLSDDDRWPWLEAIGRWIDTQLMANRPAIVACSALRRRYRAALSDGRSGVWFACLDVRPGELERRVGRRRDHFLPVSLVDDQLMILEPLESDEPGIVVNADGPLEGVVDAIIRMMP
jgi:gluconokinase